MLIISQPKPFIKLRQRIKDDLDMTYSEAAEIMNMHYTTFCAKMSGQNPWTEPEMQRALAEFGLDDETLGNLFERRTL